MFTTNEVILVQASFARLVPMQDAAADLFYGRLFAIAPSLRELFPSDLRDQKRKLMQMIATAVGGLNSLDKIIPAVKALGARHSGYGVTGAHYAIVGEPCYGRSSAARRRLHAGDAFRLG
jgi:hemoglobin-like flavoprotein